MFVRVSCQGGVVGLDVQLEVTLQTIMLKESDNAHGIYRRKQRYTKCTVETVRFHWFRWNLSERTIVILVLAGFLRLGFNKELTLQPNLLFVPWRQRDQN